MRKTKIVCTIGPACDSEETLQQMATIGMNVARINFSHGTPAYNRSLVEKIRKIRQELALPIAVLMDLQGPKIRIGVIREGQVLLTAGKELTLTTESTLG